MSKKEKVKQEEKEDPSQKEAEVIAEESLNIEKARLESLEQQVKDLKDKNLRVLAESENLRKRLQKEKGEMQVYIRENLVCEFLNPIDHFEKALSFKDQQSDEVKNWMVGFEMILTQFKDVLNQNEIRAIEAVGNKFDPHYHEAMETEETDQCPPNTVIEEHMKGYMMGDRVIRPSKVKVSKSKSLGDKPLQEDKKV